MVKNCYRCDNELDEPVRDNASYVVGEDTSEETEKSIIVEKRHNDYTRTIRERLRNTHGLNTTQANMVISRNDESYLQNGMSHDLSNDPFDETETTDPSKPEEDPEVIRVDSRTETVTEQRTGLVCESCVKDSDDVIW